MFSRVSGVLMRCLGRDAGRVVRPAVLLGRRGERAAARYLMRKGFRIIFRNFRVPRGELDLVARHRNELVFVEVKTRRRGHIRGRPQDAVDAEKQRRIVRAAMAYLRMLGCPDVRFRFDIVEVYMDEAGRHPECRLIEGAFGMPEGWRYLGGGERME